MHLAARTTLLALSLVVALAVTALVAGPALAAAGDPSSHDDFAQDLNDPVVPGDIGDEAVANAPDPVASSTSAPPEPDPVVAGESAPAGGGTAAPAPVVAGASAAPAGTLPFTGSEHSILLALLGATLVAAGAALHRRAVPRT